MKQILGLILVGGCLIAVFATAGPASGSLPGVEESSEQFQEDFFGDSIDRPRQQIRNYSEVEEIRVVVIDGQSDLFEYSWKEAKFLLFTVFADEAKLCFRETKSSDMFCQTIPQEGTFSVSNYAEIQFLEEGIEIVRYNNIDE